MQGIANLTDRFEVAGETEIFSSEDSDAVDDSQSARPRPATTGRAYAAPLCSRTLGALRRTCAVVTAVMEHDARALAQSPLEAVGAMIAWSILWLAAPGRSSSSEPELPAPQAAAVRRYVQSAGLDGQATQVIARLKDYIEKTRPPTAPQCTVNKGGLLLPHSARALALQTY